MISRLRPLDVAVLFEDRTYGLGDTIDITVEMSPHRDSLVRKAQIDLVVEERWTERTTVTIEKPIVQSIPTGRGAMMVQHLGTRTETKTVTRRHREKSVHGSVTFLENVRLGSGDPARHRIRLDIQPEPPPHVGEAQLTWWLQTVVDIVGARDIKPRQKVKISAV